MGKNLKLFEKEYEFIRIVWKHEPMNSGDLAKRCAAELDWKRTTTYTVLKKLCERGMLQNQDAIVTSLVKEEEVQCYESRKLVEKVFHNSLPSFITAFVGERKIDRNEIDEIRKLIDSFDEES